jgi:hypothetical protein
MILTGILAPRVGSHSSSPGVLQAVRLQNLLKSKEMQIQAIQGELDRLQTEASLLEKSTIIQEREIRRVLGYAAPDELIFDFTPSGQL